MPELPEVETVVRELVASKLIGETIRDVQVFFPKLVDEGDACLLKSMKITGVFRRAKYIVIQCGEQLHLTIHLRMTGKLHFAALDAPLQPYEKGRLLLNKRALVFCDVRTFGRWSVVDDLTHYFREHGQEPLDQAFDFEQFYSALHSSRRPLKSLLLDQSILAGIGNIYADEALFTARLHPLRAGSTLSKKEAKLLLAAVREVLEKGILHGGSSLGKNAGNFKSSHGGLGKQQEHFLVYAKTGKPCPRCGHALERIVVAERSTHFCPSCQKGRAHS